jgi:hypothetical protein
MGSLCGLPLINEIELPSFAHMPATTRPENPWINLGFNLILPVLLLTKGADWLPQAPAWAILVVALAFPVGYFIWDWQRRGKRNMLSVLGMISVLLTGGIGLLKLPPEAFLIKETLLPVVIGLVIAGSAFTRVPAMKLIFYNEDLVDTQRINARLDTPEKASAFQHMLKKATLVFAASSLVTALVNFIVTSLVVTADPRVDAALFNAQVGRQTGITFVVLTLCSLPFMAYSLYLIISGLKQLTGLDMESIFLQPATEQKKATENP